MTFVFIGLKRIKRNLILYNEYVRLNLIRISHNKWESILGGISWFVLQVCGLISALVIVDKAGPIKGWSFYEVGLLYGAMASARALCMLFFDSVWQIGYIVRYGEFDLFLTRPVSPFLQLISYRIEPAGLGNLFFSLITFIFCLLKLQLHLSVLNILALLSYLICGALIVAALFLIANCVPFWLVGGQDIALLMLNFYEFIKFPVTVFPKLIRILLTWVIPFTFVNYYPISLFLEKEPSSLWFLPFIVCLFLWLIAVKIWENGIKSYNSTGS